MKILIVCSGKPSNPQWNFKIDRSYVYEQIDSIEKLGIQYDVYFIEGKGIVGYIKNHRALQKKIREYQPDIIHAHYGLSGLLANFQRKKPVVTTYHGSDINKKSNLKFSKLSSWLSKENIFVYKKLANKINYKQSEYIIPCGVDTQRFYPMDKDKAREKLGLEKDMVYGLFASAFDNKVKNYPLARDSIALSRHRISLLELKNLNREEVNLLMNAVDFLLMTSFTEGSPMVIKEAMCCNTPIVTVDVGDVKDVIGQTRNCYVTPYDSQKIASSIDKVLAFNSKTDGRNTIEKYSLDNIAKQILEIYKKVNHANKKVR